MGTQFTCHMGKPSSLFIAGLVLLYTFECSVADMENISLIYIFFTCGVRKV